MQTLPITLRQEQEQEQQQENKGEEENCFCVPTVMSATLVVMPIFLNKSRGNRSTFA